MRHYLIIFLFCDINFVYDTQPSTIPKMEHETIKEELGVENHISFPVIMETNGYNVHDEFSGFCIFYKYNLLPTTLYDYNITF